VPRKSKDIWVLIPGNLPNEKKPLKIPGNRLTSRYQYPEIPMKKNIFREYLRENETNFQKYFRILLRGIGTIDSCKKPEFKNLMLQSL